MLLDGPVKNVRYAGAPTLLRSCSVNPFQLYLEFRSERGYIMGEMVFDVADVDVNNMSTWFSLDRLVDWFPHDLNVKILNFTLR